MRLTKEVDVIRRNYNASISEFFRNREDNATNKTEYVSKEDIQERNQLEEESKKELSAIIEKYKDQVAALNPNRKLLTDIVLSVTYSNAMKNLSSTLSFAWSVVLDGILDNLASNSSEEFTLIPINGITSKVELSGVYASVDSGRVLIEYQGITINAYISKNLPAGEYKIQSYAGRHYLSITSTKTIDDKMILINSINQVKEVTISSLLDYNIILSGYASAKMYELGLTDRIYTTQEIVELVNNSNGVTLKKVTNNGVESILVYTSNGVCVGGVPATNVLDIESGVNLEKCVDMLLEVTEISPNVKKNGEFGNTCTLAAKIHSTYNKTYVIDEALQACNLKAWYFEEAWTDYSTILPDLETVIINDLINLLMDK